ncbi:MAG: InlB B-repeat-containing protein [Bilifractor sp.]
MKKRRRQRFLSLMLALCMIVSAGMMTPLNISADSADVSVTQETWQEDSALTGGAAADQTETATTDTGTDIVSATQDPAAATADTQTEGSGTVPEETAAPAAEQTDDAGTGHSNAAGTESTEITETPSEPQIAETQTDGTAGEAQSTGNTDASAANEEQKQDPDSEETEESWPAQTFTGHANNITVNVTAAEGIFPAGTTMVTTAVSAQTAKDIANQASDGQTEVVDAIGVDISFRDASGNEIEPKDGQSVEVSMTVDAASTLSGDNFSVVHKSDDGNVQTVTENATAEGAVFEADAFSIYVITSEGPAIETWTFHDADGNVIAGSSQKVKNGEKVYAPTTPEKKGYKFIGWSYTASATALGEGDPGNFDTWTPPVNSTREVKLYPVFQQAYYVFFLDKQGRVSTTKEGISGDEISVSDVTIPLDSTHSVTGWYTNSELNEESKVTTVKLTDHNVTLYPNVEKGHYLYFSSGDGASYVEPVFVVAGKAGQAPEEPTRPGYTFSRWSEEEGGSEYSFGSTISEDTTLYAVWEANSNTKYTIIYWWENANDEDYSYHDNKVEYGVTGSEINIGSISNTYAGFTLNTDKTNQANAGATISGDGSTIVNIYYSRNTYAIQFYKSEESWWSYSWEEMTQLRITAKYGANISEQWPTSTSKIWGTKKGRFGGEGPYQSGISTMPLDGDVFYYVEQSGSYTMNLNYYVEDLNGAYILDHTDSFKTDDTGWTTTKEDHYDIEGFTYLKNVKDGSKFKYVSRYIYEVSFHYSRNSYSIKFVNGDSTSSQTFKYGEDISKVDLQTAPERPAGTPSGYTFAGWFDNELGAGSPVVLTGTMPAYNITLYAKWAAPTYTGTVHTNIKGTGTTMELTINYGDMINENDMPTVEDADGNVIQEGNDSYTVTVPAGYTWAGWATKSGDDYTIYNFNTEVYSDITLYPYYINGMKYTVSYDLGGVTGTVPVDGKQYAENSYADIAEGTTAPPGKTFLYWNTKSDGTGVKLYPGGKLKVTADITLYAIYGDTAAKTSLTYHANYPVGEEPAPKIRKGLENNVAISLEEAEFETPEGYYFAYWKDANGKQYAVGTEIGIDNTSANDLYAVWEKKKEITLKANSGTYTYDGSTHSASGVETDIFTINGVSYTVSGYTTSSPERKDAGNYSNIISGTYVVKDGSGADVTDQFTVNTVNGSLTINKRTVNLKSESDSKAYDGIALTKPEVTVTGDGFAAGEVSDLKATGTITTEGSVPNTITYTAEAGFNAGNYEITKSEGTLTITQNADKITVTAGSDTKVYDGTALTKNTYSIAGLPERFTVAVTVSGSITDAGSTENEVTSVIIRKGNEDVTSQFSGIETVSGMLTVTKRTVTLKSESASKAFDGNALTAPKVTITGDGFVDGEVSEVKATGSITRVGSTANKIEYTQNSGFKADNYTITKDEGTLTITQNENEIVVNAKNAEKKYDGSPLTKNEADVTGLPEGYTAEVTVSGTITDAGTANNVVKSVVIKDASGNDVTDQFKTITKNNGTLTVTKRSVTLTSESMSREYDGTALTASNVTITGDGFVTGEVTDLTATGTITNVGSVANTISYTKGTGFKAGNYDIKKSEGTLTITANTAEITVTAGSSSKKYDGTALTKNDYTITGLPEGFRAVVKVSGSITDVGTVANKVVSVTIWKNDEDVTRQFSGIQTADGTLTVEKRIVTLASESASKVYDGTALTKPEVTIAGDGFVTGEVSELKATGSIIKVGSVPNTITYTTEAGFNAGNYEITNTEGTLTITQNANKITVTAGSDTKTYDGTALTKNTYSITGLPEGFTAEVMVSGSITDAGSAENEVTSVIIRKGNEDVTSQFSGIKTASGTLTVTKRTVKLTSESASKQFDGKPLTRPEVEVSGDGFVAGEVSDLQAAGSITNTGSTANTITYKTLEGFKADNYTIELDEGTLTITQNEKEIVVNAKNAEKKYDGSPLTKNEADVTGLPEGYMAEVTVSGTITDAGTAGNVIADVVILNPDGKDVTDQFKTIAKNNGTLTVTKRSVVLTSESMSREYDGTALTAPNVTVTGDGFVNGEVTDLRATGTITNVGSATNTIAYTEGTGFKADNYEIEKSEGTLTITANTAAIEVKADSDSRTYDDTALTKSSYSATGLPEGFAAEATVTGSITDAGTADNVIASVVIKKGNEDVTDQFSNIAKTNGTLTVTQRKVTLTSGSASKAYDGTALTKPEVTVRGDGFVAGEVSDVKATGSITKTGSVINTITYSENKGFKADNYEITKTEGTLTVTANTAMIKVTADSDSKTYDGTALTKSTFSITGLPAGFTPDVTVSGSITDAGTAVNEVKSVVIRKDGKDVTDQFANIETVSGTLTVNKRTVNLKSESASKVFDGTALTAPNVTVTGDGFVADEVDNLKAVGTITRAGSVKNEIRYTEKSGFKADNYTISKDEGTLTITQNENEIVVNAKNATKTYDGTALTESGSEVTGLPNGYTAEVTVSGSITNAGTAENKVTSVVIRKGDEDVTDQFKTITKNNGTLTVSKRSVSLSSETVSREYDGTALTAPIVTVAGDGFVAGEVTDLKATGTITKVGSTANPITYTERAGFKAGNYEISKSEGTLTITANTAAIEVKADSDSKTYDGTVLTKNSYSITGLPAGFTAEVKVSGSITDAGTTDNKVTSVVIRKGDEDVTDQFSGIKRTDGALTVEKRKVTLTSETASKEYDGTALTKPEVTIGGDGFVPGEVSDLKATGSITDVGSTENKITYTRELGKFKEDNYEITENPGTLTITMNNAAVITVTAADGAKEYDGTALTASGVTVTGLPDGFTAEGKAVGSIVNVWESEKKGNNPVGNVIIRDKAGKDVTKFFTKVTTKPGTLTIIPKSITLKSGSAAKSFDGKALTNHTLELQDRSILVPLPILAENDQRTLGIAEKDQITFEFTGSQTYVGSSDNIFTYEISEKPQTTVQPKLASALIAPVVKAAASEPENHKVSDNYEVSVEYGTLKVADDDVPSDLVVTKTHDDKTYQIGDTIEFTITVTNIYDDARTITLEEQEGVTFENGESSVIFENVARGETRSAKVTHVVTAADIKAGEYSNTVKAVFGNGGGSEPGGNPDEPGGNPGEPGGTPEDPGKTWETTDKEDEFAHMTISKVVTSTPKNGSKYVAGETVTYLITVTNDGTVTLTGLVIKDDLTNATWTADSLSAGDELTFTTSYTVTAADAENGSVMNEVTGQADRLKTPDPGTATVTTEAEEPENPEPTQPTKPETTVTPTPLPTEPEEPEPAEPTKPAEPEEPQKPTVTPQATVTPTPMVTAPPTEVPSTRPVHTGNTIRKNPDTVQQQTTRLVHTGAVRTGDAGMIGVNVIIVIGAAAGIGVLVRRRKKEKKQ